MLISCTFFNLNSVTVALLRKKYRGNVKCEECSGDRDKKCLKLNQKRCKINL